MSLALLALLLPASTSLLLVDDTITVSAGDWRYVEVVLKQKPATVDCEFRLLSGGEGVRISLLDRQDLDSLRAGAAPRPLAASPAATAGRLHYAIPRRGDYVLVLENRTADREPAKVQLKVTLDFSGRPVAEARFLSPARRAAVIAISFAVFAAIAIWSARRMFQGVDGA